MQIFLDYLRDTFAHTAYLSAVENRKTDLQYQKLNRQHGQTFNEIRNKLGKDRKLMLKLERLQNEMGFIDDQYVYLQGFIDCVVFLKLIKLI